MSGQGGRQGNYGAPTVRRGRPSHTACLPARSAGRPAGCTAARGSGPTLEGRGRRAEPGSRGAGSAAAAAAACPRIASGACCRSLSASATRVEGGGDAARLFSRLQLTADCQEQDGSDGSAHGGWAELASGTGSKKGAEAGCRGRSCCPSACWEEPSSQTLGAGRFDALKLGPCTEQSGCLPPGLPSPAAPARLPTAIAALLACLIPESQ